MSYLFADFETRSEADLPTVGAYAYARHPSTEVLTFCGLLNTEEVAWSPLLRGGTSDVCPATVKEHVKNDGWVIFWNAFFDRHIWNEVAVKRYGWPPLRLEQTLCAQAQAEASNLPGSLSHAARELGGKQKSTQGARLITLLSKAEANPWTSKHTAAMPEMRLYCKQDVEVMRELWNACRPLTLSEWGEYHASERVNDRGVAVDTAFAEAACEFAANEFADVDRELAEVTGDPEIKITTHLRKAEWLYHALAPSPGIQALVYKGEAGGKPRFSCDKEVQEAVATFLDSPEQQKLFSPEQLDRVVGFLDLVESGNSAATQKYARISSTSFEGRLHGQYSFNGAGQTGRFSSRGVQLHNLSKASVSKEPNASVDAIEMILSGASGQELTEKFGLPVSRLLGRLVRPTFIAPPGKTLVWGDYRQIEANVLPWLSDSAGGREVLEGVRKGLDRYKSEAAKVFGASIDDVTPEQRDVGKVAVLSLGFGGAVGAFTRMAKSYGKIFSVDQAQEIVAAWRAANPWCGNFWRATMRAVENARSDPGTWMGAGRLAYVFLPNLLGGSMVCRLPCGRWLVYRKWLRDEDENFSYLKRFGSAVVRVPVWHGVLVENATQGFSGSIFRHALTKLTNCVLHTHDELCIEVDEKDLEAQITELRRVALDNSFEDLPLDIAIKHGPFYRGK